MRKKQCGPDCGRGPSGAGCGSVEERSMRATTLAPLTWPAARLGEALEALGRHCRWLASTATTASCTIESAAARLGLEAEPVAVPYADIGRVLKGGGPMIVAIDSGYLLLVGRGHVLMPDLSVVPVRLADV